jgi:GNAT superfamily N-acetyltransferase
MDPEITPSLRAAVLDLWTAVTADGGAVGFATGTPSREIARTAERTLDLVASGHDSLVVALDGDQLVAMAFLAANDSRIFAHWRTVKRLMVHPDRQGKGLGSDLVRAVERHGGELGLEQLHLTVRDGTGTDALYARHGYTEVGRVPRAIRLSSDDYRDEIHMVLEL